MYKNHDLLHGTLLIHEYRYSETIDFIYKTTHFSFVGVEALSHFLEVVSPGNILKITFLHITWEDLIYRNFTVAESGHPCSGRHTIADRIQAARRRNNRASRSNEALSKWKMAWELLAKITEISPLQHIHVTLFDLSGKYDFTYHTMLPCLKHVQADSFLVDGPKRLEDGDKVDVVPYDLRLHWQLGQIYIHPADHFIRKYHRNTSSVIDPLLTSIKTDGSG